MKQTIDCDTCGYPLLPEEREGLVEINGRLCKPRTPLRDAEIFSILRNIDPEMKRLNPGMKALVQEIEAAINARGEQ